MDKFSKNFPSLKHILTVDNSEIPIEIIPLAQVELHCLDRKIVERDYTSNKKLLEVIDNIREDLFSGRNWKMILKKELNLK